MNVCDWDAWKIGWVGCGGHGQDLFGEEKTVTIHIAKLRKKLGDNTRNPSIIVNLRGIGYKFIPPTGEAL